MRSRGGDEMDVSFGWASYGRPSAYYYTIVTLVCSLERCSASEGNLTLQGAVKAKARKYCGRIGQLRLPMRASRPAVMMDGVIRISYGWPFCQENRSHAVSGGWIANIRTSRRLPNVRNASCE